MKPNTDPNKTTKDPFYKTTSAYFASILDDKPRSEQRSLLITVNMLVAKMLIELDDMDRAHERPTPGRAPRRRNT